MGLDITAYKNIKPVENPVLDDGYPVDLVNNWLPGASMDWSEKIWPGRGEGVDSKTVYEFEESYEFRAGSYSGYNWWRSNLEEFASNKSRAFKELIEFADNEGVIGSVVAKKLSKDFHDNEEAAKEYSKHIGDGEYWMEKYYDWMEAFDYASNNGAVDFG